MKDDKARSLLLNPLVQKYGRNLEKLRKYRPHQLTDIEEKLLTELSPTRVSSWNKLFEKVLSDLYNPDRQIRMQAEELIQGNQELLFKK